MIREFLTENKKESILFISIAVFIALSLISLISLYVGGILLYLLLIFIISMIIYILASVFIYLFLTFYYLIYKEFRNKETNDHVVNWIIILNCLGGYCVFYLAYVLSSIF